jgi:hypothetical protein
MEFDQIYAILDNPSNGSAQDWANRYLEHPAYQKYISQPLQAAQSRLAQTAHAPAREQPAQFWRRNRFLRCQFLSFARNLKILTRDRTSLALWRCIIGAGFPHRR